MIGKRLEELRKVLKLSQKEIAEKIKIPQRTYSNYENESNKIPQDILQSIATIFHVNLNWLLTGEGEMFLKPWVLGQTRLGESYLACDSENFCNKKTQSEVVYLPVLDAKVSAGHGIENFEIVYTDKYALEKRLIMPYSPDKCKFLQVKGDSMYPTLHEGDYIVVAEGVIDTNGIYVLNRGGQLFVKRLEFRLATNTLIIKSDNPNYSTEEISQEKINEHFLIIGRVILHIHPSR